MLRGSVVVPAHTTVPECRRPRLRPVIVQGKEATFDHVERAAAIGAAILRVDSPEDAGKEAAAFARRACSRLGVKVNIVTTVNAHTEAAALRTAYRSFERRRWDVRRGDGVLDLAFFLAKLAGEDTVAQ